MLNKIILGTVQLGMTYGINKSQITVTQALQILNLAYKSNINTYDTAQSYGTSELLLSNISHKSNITIITKIDFSNIIFTPIYELNKKKIINKINVSLINLKLQKLDVLLLHNFNDFNNKPLLDILFDLSQQNIINTIGISIYTIQQALSILQDTRIKIIQIPFNFLDKQWNNPIFLEKIKNNNVQIHVRSIFLQGVLLNNYDKWPILNQQTKNIYDTINNLCLKFKLSKSEFCIKYVNSIDYIDKIIFGINNIQQLQNNITIFNNIDKFNNNELHYINTQFHSIPNKLINPSLW